MRGYECKIVQACVHQLRMWVRAKREVMVMDMLYRRSRFGRQSKVISYVEADKVPKEKESEL